MISFILEFRKRIKEFIKLNIKKNNANQNSRMSWAASQRFSFYS